MEPNDSWKKRSVSRLLSDDLILSFVPDAEQPGWHTLTRTKYQLTRDRVRLQLQSQLESLLEEYRDAAVTALTLKRRKQRLVTQLKKLGYSVQLMRSRLRTSAYKFFRGWQRRRGDPSPYADLLGVR